MGAGKRLLSASGEGKLRGKTGHHNSRLGQAGFFITLVASTLLMGSSLVAGKNLLQDGFLALLLVSWHFFVAALATLLLVLLEGRPMRRSFRPMRACATPR